MKAKPDCIVCMFRQALNTARLVSDDPDVHLRVLQALAERTTHTDLARTPAALSQPAYETLTDITGVADPYAAIKHQTNQTALALLPECREMVNAADDPLDAALHVAAAGNVIDLGIGHEFDIERDLRAMMNQPFAISHLERFRDELKPGRRLLYLGDNAGEIAFDRVLVEHLLSRDVHVTLTVKSRPIINDATMTDAEEVGLTDMVEVVETGAGDIGVNWQNVSGSFREAFAEADLIVGKGHGNFETCNDRPENIYFLLKAKCPMVAEELGCQLGDIVFEHRA